eukprot:TRINITY_DN8330_c0_g1_i2.p1 TRINITY_DN8330_c0_g1~~TRINITY_DN8330_c0_g1_i2.p1  ORF type:complete len:313 (-),score=59.30 TRINITY_DN8330_c0_g1_i2:46-984(-)
MGGVNYTRLHAQIVKARARGVERFRLVQAEQVLKTLSVDSVSKEELSGAMKWQLVTKEAGERIVERCTNTGCPLPAGRDLRVEGTPVTDCQEVLDFSEGSVSAALQASKGCRAAVGDLPGEQWLFEQLTAAAVSAPENCLWKAGGKLIFSSPDRNQAPLALTSTLMKYAPEAAGAIGALMDWTKSKFQCEITAVQVNLHLDGSSFHAQHRDIFSGAQKEKAGRDCTCSFKKCNGTVCFSVGSSRQVCCETMSDEMSHHENCGEDCGGFRELRWFNSGCAMYFNDKWNNGHTHGIVQATGPCGPRISIALLCA